MLIHKLESELTERSGKFKNISQTATTQVGFIKVIETESLDLW